MLQHRRVLAVLLILTLQVFAPRKFVGEIENKSVPCALIDAGSNGTEVSFSANAESDGVHSVVIVPQGCPNLALNLKVDSTRAHEPWWKRFRAALSTGHPG